jgi:hypothetical protein
MKYKMEKARSESAICIIKNCNQYNSIQEVRVGQFLKPR